MKFLSRHKRGEGNVYKEIKKILDLCNFVLYKAKVFCRGIAQLVEHRSPKPSVVSSNLTAPATQDEGAEKRLFLYISST